MILGWFIWFVSENEICYAIFNDARQLIWVLCSRVFTSRIVYTAPKTFFHQNGKMVFISSINIQLNLLNTVHFAMSWGQCPIAQTTFISSYIFRSNLEEHLFHLTVIGYSMHWHVKSSLLFTHISHYRFIYIYSISSQVSADGKWTEHRKPNNELCWQILINWE